jgi:alkylated DNA repair protein alkB family protein 8
MGVLSPDELEQKHVHAVYEQIAEHFSNTRYAPWPHVADFVRSLPTGATLADVGCGNGKYMGLNKGVAAVGCDMSENLLRICRRRGFDVVVGDTMAIPFASERFDAVLSIAVFHHISTEHRRRAAARELLRVCRRGGRVLV